MFIIRFDESETFDLDWFWAVSFDVKGEFVDVAWVSFLDSNLTYLHCAGLWTDSSAIASSSLNHFLCRLPQSSHSLSSSVTFRT